jgi:hypothetical protein
MNATNLFLVSPPPAPDARVSVLAFWRCFAFDEFTAERRARVEAFVTRAVIADPRWRLAAAGDAASAIGIALSRHTRFLPDLAFDVAATAVLFCALRGDPAARVVLGAMIRNHCVRESIASSWSATPSVAYRCGEG